METEKTKLEELDFAEAEKRCLANLANVEQLTHEQNSKPQSQRIKIKNFLNEYGVKNW